MTSPIKALLATIATGAMAVSAAVPALAEVGDGHAWNGGNSRQAVEMCSRAAERQAGRLSNGHARVTDVRNVRDTRFGFEVRGRIAVNSPEHNRNDRSWRNRDFNHDSGSFTCRVVRGCIANLKFDGIRGL